RVVACTAPQLIAGRLLAPALLQLLDVAGDRQPRRIPDENRDRISQPVARMIAAPRRAGTHDANLAREVTLRAHAVPVVRREFDRIDDVSRPGARDMALAGPMAALATDTGLSERWVAVTVVRARDRFHPSRVAVQARRQHGTCEEWIRIPIVAWREVPFAASGVMG